MAYSLPKDYKPTTKSGYKGVVYSLALGAKRRKPWMAYISIGKETKTIGYFTDKESAALAYNTVAKQIKGENTYMNIV